MAKKRGNNDGSIRQRKDGRWEGRVTVGYYPDGRQKQKSVYGKTQAEVQAKKNALQADLDRGTYMEPSTMTVGDWLMIWARDYGSMHWRPKTASVNFDNIRLHLVPALGKIKLSKLRPDHVQSFINAQIEKNLAPATIKKHLEPLKGALKQAVENGLVLRNVADHAKLPKIEAKEILFLNVDEQNALLATLPDNNNGRAVRFILASGLRASELCGLRWCDIDEATFTVRQGAQHVKIGDVKKHQLVIAAPKTKAGRRTVPLTGTLKEILDAQRKGQIAYRLSIGEGWHGKAPGEGDTPVFTSTSGGYMNHANLDTTLRTALKKAGLPARGLHALRHSFATNWVRAAGSDIRSLSEVIGHTNVAFTMQQYVHSEMTSKLAGMQAIEQSVKKA